MKWNSNQLAREAHCAAARLRSIKENGKNPSRLLARAEIEGALRALFARAYSTVGPLACTAYVSREPLCFEERRSGREKPLRLGDPWAEEVFDCAWMHMTGTIPSGIRDEDVCFRLDTSGEGLVFDRTGIPVQGITSYASQFEIGLGDPRKTIVQNSGLSSGGQVDFWIDCGANDLFGNLKNHSRLAAMEIVRENSAIRGLYYDLGVLISVYDYNPDHAFELAVYRAVRTICRHADTITERQAERLRGAIRPLLQTRNPAGAFTFSAIGHAHLDLAWLWPIRESRRKGARTFANQLHNIARYPGYVFGASQAQLYQWIKEDHPALYKRVKAAAQTPSWDVQGATWVEMDSNLISGESMLRQFYYGKRFFRQEFGQEMEIFWVPDSFGYSACIPQVMRLANVPYFLTQKMSWNTVNPFPYHTFHWQGLDGSTVFAHMLPENTYNSPMNMERLTFGMRHYRERAISGRALSLFGIGDGGGGPGYEHIERATRLRDLRDAPRVKMEKSRAFFRRLDDGSPYPTYRGELYLERHRGTYTSQSAVKRANRQCEFRLRNYELLAVWSGLPAGQLPLSLDRLEQLWKEVLLYQFHDILPGSSINRVYEECLPRYQAILRELAQASEPLLSACAPGAGLLNLNAFSYHKWVKWNGEWRRFRLRPMSFTAAADGVAQAGYSARCTPDTIENDRLRVVFHQGAVVSLYDKQLGREMAAPGSRMAQLLQYRDRGDCWDIRPVDYYKKQRPQAAECIAFRTGTDGPQAYAIGEYRWGNSRAVQRFTITDGEALVDVLLDLDWHEEEAMLRLSFPTAIESEVCSFNIQFGHLKRRTTEKDPIERAQFEVSGQKFVDQTDGTCGIALLNDCKYGYRCKGGVMDMNVVRTPKGGPGVRIDQGRHTVRYALMTHGGGTDEAIYAQSYWINNPAIHLEEGRHAPSRAFYRTDNERIILESVKVTEDGRGIAARFYNAGEQEETAHIKIPGFTPRGPGDLFETLLREDSSGVMRLRPFELVNLLLTAEGESLRHILPDRPCEDS